MILSFKDRLTPVNPGYHPSSPSPQCLRKKGLYGSLSLMFALTVGLGTPAQAANPYGRIVWDPTNYKVDEYEGKVYLKAKRVDGSSGTVTVKYGTRSQTARAGMNADYDYQATSGELTWGPGDQSSKQVEITIYDDTQHEEEEYFNVVLLDAIGTPTTPDLGGAAKVKIKDNDQPPPSVVPPTQQKLITFMPTLIKPIPLPPTCLSCPIFRISFRLGMSTLFKIKSIDDAEARGFDGGLANFDEASQAFLVGLQNGLAQLNLSDLEVSVTEAGAILTVPIYNAQGELEGEYHAVAGEPVATSETEVGIFSTASGATYLVYQDENGNSLRANLYATLAPEILMALQLNFPDAQITQEEEVVTLTLGEDESYRFIANHFVDSVGLDTDPLTTNLIDANSDGMADYAVLSAAGKEQLVYSVD
jgi:hypothetical protein